MRFNLNLSCLGLMNVTVSTCCLGSEVCACLSSCVCVCVCLRVYVCVCVCELYVPSNIQLPPLCVRRGIAVFGSESQGPFVYIVVRVGSC
jgi:hypothetical protein